MYVQFEARCMEHQKFKSHNLVNRMRGVRAWELLNLPTYGTTAGYSLFLELACLSPAGATSLKIVHLSMPCAERTTRLLFRNLERDGLIHLPRDKADKRCREFQLTSKFQIILDEWKKFIYSALSE